MNSTSSGHIRSCVLGLLLFAAPAAGDDLRVAVASNFAGAAGALVAAFERDSGHQTRLVAGSTGKHYAQILNGAPFGVFLAADADRPQRLERAGLAIPGSRFTYALGRLVLWSPAPDRVDAAGKVLEGDGFSRLALANPALAPYGRAAREVLEKTGQWQRLQGRLVRGENVGQAYQFVHSGAAELGFVAASQVIDRGGSRWDIPSGFHAPIEQQAVLLQNAPAARAFLNFVRSEAGRALIRAHGYHTPDVR
jgi:molybdate transport system substrate-binding protein